MEQQKTALVTGASKGLGFGLAKRLAQKGWKLLITARTPGELLNAKRHLSRFTETAAISGDMRDEIHLLEIADHLRQKGWTLDLLVNNASALGISPLRRLLDHPVIDLHLVLHTNMIAPISLLQKVKSYLRSGAKVVNVSSDAARETYETWGAYGSSKAGLDHMTLILAKEHPEYYFYAFDPGDMRTEMHQSAFPNQDISDRPLPDTYAVPALNKLISGDFESGRYTIGSFKEELA